jgi:capsular polysaccharide biosynthesis protein
LIDTLLILDLPDSRVGAAGTRFGRHDRRSVALRDPQHDRALLSPEVAAFGRYAIHQLGSTYEALAEHWASAAVARLADASALVYDGVDIAPALRCALYYRFLPLAVPCVRLARILEIEGDRPVRVVTDSPLHAGLFTALLRARRVSGRVTTVGWRPTLRGVAKPVTRLARDTARAVLRTMSPGRSRHRVLFLLHHPALRPRVSRLLAEMEARGFNVAILNSEPPAHAEATARDFVYGDFAPSWRALARVHWTVARFRRRTARLHGGDLEGPVSFPFRLWRGLARDLAYGILTDIEILRRALADMGPDVLLYTNRGVLGTVAYAAGRQSGVPTAQIELTDHFWDDDYRHCQADLFVVQGEESRARLLEFGVARPEAIVIAGSEHYVVEGGLPANAARAKVAADVGLDVGSGDERILLFASQPAFLLSPESYRRIVIDSLIEAMRAIPSARLVVKLHPLEGERGIAELLKDLPPGAVAVTKDYDLGTLLDASDVVIIQGSTVGLHALARDRALVVLDYRDDLPMPIVAAGAAIVVKQPRDLADALRGILENAGVRERLRCNGRTFLERYLADPGKATGRTADAIESLALGARR